MVLYFTADGVPVSSADVTPGKYELVPRATEHHEAVPAITHVETIQLAPDFVLLHTVVDSPAVPAYDEVLEYTVYPTYTSQLEARIEQLEETITALGGGNQDA